MKYLIPLLTLFFILLSCGKDDSPNAPEYCFEQVEWTKSANLVPIDTLGYVIGYDTILVMESIIYYYDGEVDKRINTENGFEFDRGYYIEDDRIIYESGGYVYYQVSDDCMDFAYGVDTLYLLKRI